MSLLPKDKQQHFLIRFYLLCYKLIITLTYNRNIITPLFIYLFHTDNYNIKNRTKILNVIVGIQKNNDFHPNFCYLQAKKKYAYNNYLYVFNRRPKKKLC